MKLDVYVQPGAKKPGYSGLHDNRIKIKVTSPPEGGKANKEVCLLLAEILKIPKTALTISSGTTSRFKTVEISTQLTKEEIIAKIIGNNNLQ